MPRLPATQELADLHLLHFTGAVGDPKGCCWFANPALRDVVEQSVIPTQFERINAIAASLLGDHTDIDVVEARLERARYHFNGAHPRRCRTDLAEAWRLLQSRPESPSRRLGLEHKLADACDAYGMELEEVFGGGRLPAMSPAPSPFKQVVALPCGCKCHSSAPIKSKARCPMLWAYGGRNGLRGGGGG